MKAVDLKNELDKFLEVNNEFVFSVKGIWGVGKTHFIKNYMQNLKIDVKTEYYSLTSFDSITHLQSNFENLSSIIKKNATNFIKGKLSISTPSENRKIKSELNENHCTKNDIRTVYVFDDVERFIRGCKSADREEIEIIRFFGLLNELSYDNNVIVIVNEDVIDSEVYYQYREKYIKYSYELEPNAKDVFTNILKNKVSLSIDCINSIVESLNHVENLNLRYVIRATELFGRLYLKQCVVKYIGNNSTATALFYINTLINVTEVEEKNQYLINLIKSKHASNSLDILENVIIEKNYTIFGNINFMIDNDDNESETSEKNSIIEIRKKYNNTPIIVSKFVKDFFIEEGHYDENDLVEYLEILTKKASKIDLNNKLGSISSSRFYYMSQDEYDELLEKWFILLEEHSLDFDDILNLENLLVNFPSCTKQYNTTKKKLEEYLSENYYKMFSNIGEKDTTIPDICFVDSHRLRYDTYFNTKFDTVNEDDISKRKKKYNKLYKEYITKRISELLQDEDLSLIIANNKLLSKKDLLDEQFTIGYDVVKEQVKKIVEANDIERLHNDFLRMQDWNLISTEICDVYMAELLEELDKQSFSGPQKKLIDIIISTIKKRIKV